MLYMDSLLVLAGSSTGVDVGTSIFDVSEIMTTSVNLVRDELFTVLAIVVPAIAAVAAVVVAVKFGMKWLKNIGKIG